MAPYQDIKRHLRVSRWEAKLEIAEELVEMECSENARKIVDARNKMTPTSTRFSVIPFADHMRRMEERIRQNYADIHEAMRKLENPAQALMERP